MRQTWVLAAVALCAWAASAEERYIRVATFNIAQFGAGDEHERSLVGLVNILMATDADLVCLQEVTSQSAGREQVARLVKLLNKAASFYGKESYTAALPERYTGRETCAFLWRAPVALLSRIELLNVPADADGDGKPTFQRTPAIGLFRAGDYDFYAVSCHLYTQLEGKTSEGRGEELATLAGWLNAATGFPERDAVVLGDFNRFLNGKSDWPRILTPGHERYYRFALMEGIANAVPGFDAARDEAPSDTYSTTTSRKLSIYDQILLSAGSYREFVGTPVFGKDVGIVRFDTEKQYEWFVDDWHMATAILSDHRPVWVRLRIDLGDDD
ncbi:MAG: endonuclease/exonuclease/phosphatase family protein [FCB group bacterium]|jgi:endonuclease/exonuclease/phosphatase family metal-dependent hydrolase|nr:endonuclease/exonuclease/phosphatase family protein [FCB group bacterium]